MGGSILTWIVSLTVWMLLALTNTFTEIGDSTWRYRLVSRRQDNAGSRSTYLNQTTNEASERRGHAEVVSYQLLGKKQSTRAFDELELQRLWFLQGESAGVVMAPRSL